MARFLRSDADNDPWRARGSSTFSSAVSWAIRLKVWKTKPSLLRRIAASSLSVVESQIPGRRRIVRGIRRIVSLRSASKPLVWIIQFDSLVPHTKTLPFVGLSIVPMMFRSVLLPPPDVPKSITSSPLLTFVDTPLGAAVDTHTHTHTHTHAHAQTVSKKGTEGCTKALLVYTKAATLMDVVCKVHGDASLFSLCLAQRQQY